LCGWLLPGPYTVVPAGAPRELAICAAVLPLPYFLDASALAADVAFVAAVPAAVQVALEPLPPPVEHVVRFAVAFVGFTPADPFAFCAALPFWVDCCEVAAFAEPWVAAPWSSDLPLLAVALPLTFTLPLAFASPFAFPFPARAEPANTESAIDSTSVPRAAVRRLLILPSLLVIE
jgi:hypothetical protein